MMKNSLTSLPSELWTQICQALNIKDVCALRLSCSAWKSGTDDYFADQIFHDFYLALTSEGLRALEYVADHKIFSTHVKRLWVLPSLFRGDHTWTLDGVKRQVTAQKFMDDSKIRRPSHHPSLRLPRRKTRRRSSIEYRPLAFLSELSMEDRYVVYRDAVVDHFQVLLAFPENPSAGKPRFQDVLERCLPSFSNLHTAGLRNYIDYEDKMTERYPRVVRGISGLLKQLGFNPVQPRYQLTTSPQYIRSSSFRGSLFQSHIFSTLLAALGTTQTRVAALETSGGMMVDDGLSLTPLEEEALIPILHQLQSLSVQIASSTTQDQERQILRKDEEQAKYLLQESMTWEERKNRPETWNNRLLPLLAQAALGIESLNFTSRPTCKSIPKYIRSRSGFLKPASPSGLELQDAHFGWVSENFKFSRLTKLSLGHLTTTVPSLKRFLQTALHTLKHLTLESLVLTSKFNPSIRGEEELRGEGQLVWQETFTYLRELSKIQTLEVRSLGYQRKRVRFKDPSHNGPTNHPTCEDQRCYTSHDGISFGEWVDKLEFQIG